MRVLLISAWLGLMGAAVLWLVSIGVTASITMLIAVAANLWRSPSSAIPRDPAQSSTDAFTAPGFGKALMAANIRQRHLLSLWCRQQTIAREVRQDRPHAVSPSVPVRAQIPALPVGSLPLLGAGFCWPALPMIRDLGMRREARWACRIDLKHRVRRSRSQMGWSEFSARSFNRRLQ